MAGFELGYNFWNPLTVDCEVFIDSEPLVIEYDAFGVPINPTVFEGEKIRTIPPEGFKVDSVTFIDSISVEYNFEIINDGLEAFYVIPSNFDDSFLSINTATTNVTLGVYVETDVVGGSNKNYLVTPEIIREVNAERITYSIDGEGNPSGLDYGGFILGIIELPTSLPSDFILGEEVIRLGDKTLAPKAPLLAGDKVTIDMGEIEVPAVYGDSRDYNGVLFNLHLPYLDPINLEPFYVVGETINIEYVISLYDGEVTLILKSTKMGNDGFFSKRFSLGVDVPYSSTTLNNNSIANSNISFVGDNGVKIPFIEKMDSVSLINGGFFSNKIKDDGVLIDFEGYVEIEKVELKINCNADIAQDIESVLKNGVIINV